MIENMIFAYSKMIEAKTNEQHTKFEMIVALNQRVKCYTRTR